METERGAACGPGTRPRRDQQVIAGPETAANPGEPFLASKFGTETYYANALLFLVRPNSVTVFVAKF